VSAFKACAIIPTYNHVSELERILQRFHDMAIPSFVIDDGSDPETGRRISAICVKFPDAAYHRDPVNQGKGAAVVTGLALARAQGFTHAIQIDADGQHDGAAIEGLLVMARRNPDAIISGKPQYDDTIPASRRIGRRITTFWVAVNTISRDIEDAMCGFRVYPIDATYAVARGVIGRRMDFDTEVLVKAYWAGIAVAFVPVRVTYPSSNFSNFRIVRDNVLLSAMQTRLFFGMLWRLPRLLFGPRPRLSTAATAPRNWSQIKERGAYWGLQLLGTVYWIFGRHVCLFFVLPVTLYFFLTGREQRHASREYLERVWQRGYLKRRPGWFASFRHFMAFSSSSLDKLIAWTRRIPAARLDQKSIDALNDVERSGKGIFVITAHLGNPEVVRAIAALEGHVRMNVLMHTEHAEFFNRLMQNFASKGVTRAIPVTNVGPAVAMQLSEAIQQGEWVIITGDRVPVAERGRTIDVPFLGALAEFPQGPYILGAVLGAPVFLLFCVREGGRYRVHFTRFADKIELPRRDRPAAIRGYAERFADALEQRVAATPFQWFNFYAFWNTRRPCSMTEEAAE
jgi:predicted LPLAT superfamily acyltransferase